MANEKAKITSILIVDDEREILKALQEALQVLAPTIYTADNGNLGLQLAREHKPSVIISDFNMPELNGLEFLKSVREDRLNIPFIWMTGWAKEGLQKQAWMHGVYDIVEKPFEIETLVECVKTMLIGNPDNSAKTLELLTTKLASHEMNFAVDGRHYKNLVDVCARKKISITTFLNQLIEEELKKVA